MGLTSLSLEQHEKNAFARSTAVKHMDHFLCKDKQSMKICVVILTLAKLSYTVT